MIGSDLTPFFGINEFAFTVTLNGVSVDGIFDSAYVVSDPGMGMVSTVPSLVLPTNLVPANPVSKPVVVDGVGYVIAVHEPDGTGVSRLHLERS